MHAHEHVRVTRERRAARPPGPVPAEHAAHDPGAFVQRVVGRGGGRPLDSGARTRMGTAFGMDLGSVRVHTDVQAHALNQALRAEASTVGHHIYFREGAYRPGTPRGRRLLAHELTHVAQQGGRRGSGLSIGAPHTGAEREADAVGDRVAGGRTVDPGAVTPVAPGVVQRRYLDKGPTAGVDNWIEDTTVTKGLTKVSREKLRSVDYMLSQVLHGPHGGLQTHLLPALEGAVKQSKYGKASTSKQSSTWQKRNAAAYLLVEEIYKGEDEAAAAAAKAAAGAASPKVKKVKPRVKQAKKFPKAKPPPGPLHADPQVAALMRIGFLPEYLTTTLTARERQLLFDADEALSAKDLAGAQQIFDQLNPPVRHQGPAPAFQGWADEAYASIKPTTLDPFFDFQRATGDLMAAQRQLIVFHAQDIGGDYAKLLSYKPYQANKLQQGEIDEGRRYFNAQELRDWGTTVTQGFRGGAPLDDAVYEAGQVAADYTVASHGRSAQQNRLPKAAKEALTEEEVTALRIYTSDEYREMNAIFRDFRVDHPTANWSKYSALAKLAVSGLGKLPKAREAVSYRGDDDVRFGGHAGVLRKGATFRLPNFYSTTTMPSVAFEGSTGYVFHNKRAGRVIAPFSAFLGEGEILIPPGIAFRIKEVYRLVNGAWESDDKTPGLQGAVDFLHQGERQVVRDGRTMYLEFEEVV